jgi:hypothetical protein
MMASNLAGQCLYNPVNHSQMSHQPFAINTERV